MSSRNFKRKFRIATGDTPLTYLHKLRIDAAMRKLEVSQSNIQLIGQEVGYANTQFFRKIFKRYIGMTPTEFRDSLAPIT